LPDARTVQRDEVLEKVADASEARVYGFLPRGAQLAPFTRDRITAAFGFDEVVVPPTGHAKVSVEVLWMPIRGGPTLRRGLTGFDLKRAGIWTNPVRNRRFAAMARALLAGDQDRLGNLELPLPP